MNLVCMLRVHVMPLVMLCCVMPAMGENLLSELCRTNNPAFELRETLYITEVCVIPPRGSDWPAWLEIWNNSKQIIDLNGYSIEALQTIIKPFEGELLLRPDERCVVQVYSGEKPSADFQTKIVRSGAKMATCIRKTLFPPSFSVEEWRSIMRVREVPFLQMTNAELELVGVNELSLRKPTGELISYLCWGSTLRDFATKASQDAQNKGLFYKSKALFVDTNSQCAVLQMLHHATYTSVRNADVNATPGRPMSHDIPAPKLELPIDCYLFTETGHVEVQVAFDDQSTYPNFEKYMGWSRPMPEFFYDRDLTQSVFGGPVAGADMFWCEKRSFFLQQESFFYLADRPLYCRMVKFHPSKPSVYSDVQEIRLRLSHDVREEVKRQEERGTSKVVSLKGADVAAAVKVLAGHIDRCNTAFLQYGQKKAWMSYNFSDGGNEVKVQFDNAGELDDLALLAGLPIKNLNLSASRVMDISALKGMPLRTLNLSKTLIKAVSALRGMPIRYLDISGTEVTDVSPLVDCPLVQLRFDTKKIKNLEVLMRDGKKVKREENGETAAIEWPTDFSEPVGFDSHLIPTARPGTGK